jgi:hypothetical protein
MRFTAFTASYALFRAVVHGLLRYTKTDSFIAVVIPAKAGIHFALRTTEQDQDGCPLDQLRC